MFSPFPAGLSSRRHPSFYTLRFLLQAREQSERDVDARAEIRRIQEEQFREEFGDLDLSQICVDRDAAPMDHFSPVAPAYIRVLVLPVGRVESSRFSSLVRRLQREANIIPLNEVEDRGNGDAGFLSPKASPQGSLFYRFSAAAPSEDHEKISPYEFFREPLIVLGVVDKQAREEDDGVKELARPTAYLRERHPRVVYRQVLQLEDGSGEGVKNISSAISVTDVASDDSRRSAITELSARFLVEFTTYAKAVQASPTIQTPGQIARGLNRNSSLREGERRPGSGHGDLSHTSSPVEDGRTSDSFSAGKPPPLPATSFDQMPSANHFNGNVQRRDSEASTQSGKSRARSSSQDRGSTHGSGTSNPHGERFVATGFGQSSSQEKTRARGKARVGIVMGSIYMMSGQWREALRLLVESTTISNALTDHLWHAKGLENMLVCMLLLHWSETEFKIPKLCDAASDKGSTFKLSRGSSNPSGVPRESAESAKDTSQGHRLSIVIPSLTKKILGLLRSTEGPLELPCLVFAEASVRMAKLLAASNAANGELTHQNLNAFVASNKAAIRNTRSAGSFLDVAKAFSKNAISEILTHALPSGGDVLPTSDHIRLLAGIASAYSLIGYDRKKAMTIKDAVSRLTGSLMQARKLGAAEMGIHPAASLSTDTGAETLLAIAAQGSGIASLMTDVSRIYGAWAFPSRSDSPLFADGEMFGNPAIRFEVLRALSGFCEAAPDPQGVLLMTATMLRAAGPNAAIDASPEPVTNAFSREEQMHLATVISRTVGVSKHLGLVDVRAVYWDSFLLRGVEILPLAGNGIILDRTKLKGSDTSIDQLGPGNPLLYDPNASRPGTAVKQTSVLVCGEFSECVVTLQNPFDIPVDIEELGLVTDGLEIETNHEHEPTTLGPLRFQKVSLMVRTSSVGATKITGCRIKMQSCTPQVFPIVTKPWSARQSITTKDLGLDARKYDVEDVKHGLQGLDIEFSDVPVAVIEEMPMLVVESDKELQSGCMLLEGEMLPLTLRMCNSSPVPASVFDVTDGAEVLKHDRGDGVESAEAGATLVAPGAVVPFHFSVYGRAGVTTTKVNFYYSASGQASKHVRVATFTLEMTVNAALQVQNLQITPSLADPANMIEVSLDVRNSWPRPVMFKFQVDEDVGEALTSGGTLAPGEVRRVHQIMPTPPGMSRREEDADTARERFFSLFQLTWTADTRTGVVDLRGLALSKESLEMLRGPVIELVSSVVGYGGVSSVEVAVNDPIRIQVKMSNRGKRSAPLCVELRDLRDPTARPDHQYVVAGSFKRLLPPLEESGAHTIEYLVYPRIAGNIDLEVVLGQMSGESDPIRWLTTTLLSVYVHDG